MRKNMRSPFVFWQNHADLVIKSIIGTGVFQFIEFLQRHPESFYIFPDGAVCLKDDVDKLTGDQKGPKDLVKEPGYVARISVSSRAAILIGVLSVITWYNWTPQGRSNAY